MLPISKIDDSSAGTFSSLSRALYVAAALIVVIAGMKLSASLIVPFLLSAFIAIISFPLVSKLQHIGLSKGLSLTLSMSLVLAVGISLTLLIGNSLAEFSSMLPMYQEKIATEWSGVLLWLSERGVSVTDVLGDVFNPAAAISLVSSILQGFGGVLTNSFLILLSVIFILAEAAGVTQKTLSINNVETAASFSHVFIEKVRIYMSMKTIISMLTGVLIGTSLWLIGLDYPVLWGVLAFMLNFVPNIGSIIAAVPAVLLSIVQFGFSYAIVVTAVYVAVNFIVGNVIEPKYMGKGLGLSTLVVFVSLVFWGWVLGPVGMLLSVPLTIVVKMALDSNPDTKRLGEMLGPVDG